MRLSLAVNDHPAIRASLESTGWLSAHLNLTSGVASDDSQGSVSLVAIDVSQEPNAVHSHWSSVPLSVGDSVVIEVLPDGESDPPETITRTSESPGNLCSDVEQARSLLATVKVCDAEFWKALRRVQNAEQPDELRKIQNAIGAVLAELDRQLITPILRGHPELLAEAKAMNLR